MELEWIMIRTTTCPELGESMEPAIEWPEDREFWTGEREYAFFKMEFPGEEDQDRR